MKSKALVYFVVILSLLLSACGSTEDSNNQGDSDREENAVETVDEGVEFQEVFDEADVVAHEIRKALMKYDGDALLEYASPLLEEVIVNEHERPQLQQGEIRVPNGVELSGEIYNMYRFNPLFNEEDGIVLYRIDVLRSDLHEDVAKDFELSEIGTYEDHPEIILDYIFEDDGTDRNRTGKFYVVYFGLKKDNNDEWKSSNFETSLSSHGFSSEELEGITEQRTIIHEFGISDREEAKEKFPKDQFGF